MEMKLDPGLFNCGTSLTSPGIYSQKGLDLEEIIRSHAKLVHHISHHREEDDDQQQEWEQYDQESVWDQDELEQCEQCESLAGAYNVDMSALRFSHSKPVYKSCQSRVPTTVKLFESEYVNDMDTKQKFSFKTERKTKCVASVELKNPVFYGSKGCNLTLHLPEEIKEDCPVFGQEVTPSKAKEEFMHELIWTVDNSIECPPLKTTLAKLMLKQHRYDPKFTVQTAVQGTVTVTVSEETEEKANHVTIDIAEVIRKYNEKTSGHQTYRFGVNEEGKVTYTTKGRCEFVYGLEQFVRVETSESIKITCCTIM